MMGSSGDPRRRAVSGRTSFWCRIGWHDWQSRPTGGATCLVCGCCRHRWDRGDLDPKTLAVGPSSFSFCRDCPAWDVDEP